MQNVNKKMSLPLAAGALRFAGVFVGTSADAEGETLSPAGFVLFFSLARMQL